MSLQNVTAGAVNRGRCPAPFFEDVLFKDGGGFIEGRFCSNALGDRNCCLPCPATDWLYPDNFKTMTRAANWINVGSIVFAVFLLLSWAILPASKSGRHYLSICLTVAVVFMSMGFIVPLGAKPEQCFDEITPHSMKTSPTCALSGAFLLFGGFAAVMWVLLRALALHLQICWQVVIGKSFMWGAFAAGWVIPAIALAVSMIFSGVSFRFGETCHINHKNSMADFWIPLLTFAGITLVMQFATFGYCIKVYLASLNDDATTTENSGLPSYAPSSRATVSPRQAYRRVRRVIELQWKGISIVLLIIADVIFFAVVFVYMDNTNEQLREDKRKPLPWVICLLGNKGVKDKCAAEASKLVINQATVMAVLVLLSMNGLWCLLFLTRSSLFTAWVELIKGRFKPDTEFVSADVSKRTLFKDPGSGTYEMLSRERDNLEPTKSREPYYMASPITPLTPAAQTPVPQGKSGRETPDYFGREARYKSPTRSFSSPKPPAGILKNTGWNSQTSYASPTQDRPSPYGGYPGMDPLSMNKI